MDTLQRSDTFMLCYCYGDTLMDTSCVYTHTHKAMQSSIHPAYILVLISSYGPSYSIDSTASSQLSALTFHSTLSFMPFSWCSYVQKSDCPIHL